MNAIAYNSALDALCKIEKFDEALRLFDRMISEHTPPRQLSVNLGSFNVMADGYCAEGRFKDAIEVFRKMGECEFVKEDLRKEGREEELVKLVEEKERQKAEAKAKEAEAVEAAKKSARAAISSLLPSKFFGNKEGGTETANNANAVGAASDAFMAEAEAGKEANVAEATAIESASADTSSTEEAVKG